MGGLGEPGSVIFKSKKIGDCAGPLCSSCNSASGATLGGSVPNTRVLYNVTETQRPWPVHPFSHLPILPLHEEVFSQPVKDKNHNQVT